MRPRFLSPAIIAALVCICPLIVRAGTASLTKSEVLDLRARVAKDKEAAECFATVRKDADRALTQQPNPIETVTSAGTLASDPRKKLTGAALQDMEKVSALAWTFAVTGDKRYGDHARLFLLAWAKTNKPDANAINETKFEPMIVAYDLLRSTVPESDRAVIDGWLKGKADALAAKTWKNNWACHQMKIIGLVGFTLRDEVLIQRAREGFMTRIEGSVLEDGSTQDFHERDALHYQVYFTAPLLTLARVSERAGTPLFDKKGKNGSSLKSTVDFVVPYAKGEKTHTEFTNSKVSFDRKRAEAGEKEYVPHPWRPTSGLDLFREAAWFDPAYGKLAATLSKSPERRFSDWESVVLAVSGHDPKP